MTVTMTLNNIFMCVSLLLLSHVIDDCVWVDFFLSVCVSVNYVNYFKLISIHISPKTKN